MKTNTFRRTVSPIGLVLVALLAPTSIGAAPVVHGPRVDAAVTVLPTATREPLSNRPVLDKVDAARSLSMDGVEELVRMHDLVVHDARLPMLVAPAGPRSLVD
jgi:hypothetical protein